MLPLTLALPSETKHSSGFQPYSLSKAHLLPSAFKVQGRGLGRSPQACSNWRKKMLGITGNKAIPTMHCNHPQQNAVGAASFVCLKLSFSDQLTGLKLHGYSCLGPGTKPQAPLTALWFDDFLCKLGANINVLLTRVYSNYRWLRACWK